MKTKIERSKIKRLGTTLSGIGLLSVSFAAGNVHTAATHAQESMARTQESIAATPLRETIPEGEKARIRGVITSRDGDILRVRDEENSDRTVLLSDRTDVALTRGWLGRRRERPDTVLMPGLRIRAEGRGGAQGQLMAEKIRFKSSDLRIARAMEPLRDEQQQLQSQQGQVTEVIVCPKQEEGKLGKQVSEQDSYNVKHVATVYFDTGSAALSAKARSDLNNLIREAESTPGYLIEVAGYADKSGSEAKNMTLSEKRAESVVRYLERNGNVPLRRVLKPAAYGEERGIGDQTTSAGRAENRRVEARVLASRNMASR